MTRLRGSRLWFVAALLLAACGNGSDAASDRAAALSSSGVHFPQLTGRVVDEANLLDPGDEARLEAASADVERDLGPQFVVVTVNSLEGRPIEMYGVDLGRTWGIGHRGRNDGVILLVAPNERKVRIEVGAGLERRVTDPFAGQVIRQRILPRFRAGDMRGGILAGSNAIIERLRSRESDAEIAAEDHLVI